MGMKALIAIFSLTLISMALPATGQTPETSSPPQPQSSPSPTSTPSPDNQQSASEPPAAVSPAKPIDENKPGAKVNDRIFGVIPNYRTVEDERLEPTRLGTGEKFKLGLQDSFDYFAYPAAGVFAGIDMAQRQTQSFGQGAAGFAKYYGAAFADQTIGNMMSESVFPSVLKQDPRYFPLAKGGFWKRSGYAISREWITRNDSGKNGFNYSELGGNAAAVAISNAYYPPENRTASNNAYKYAQQIGLDAFFNILKEFWPDIRHKMFDK
jgi:hypothetical protein